MLLPQGIDQAFQGKFANKVQVGKHAFKLQPVTVVVTATGVKAEGFFRHDIVGKDDHIEYLTIANRGEAAIGVITKLERRGLALNPVIKFFASGLDILVPGAEKVTLEAIRAAQNFKVGSWEASAKLIVDEMAERLAQELL